MNFVIINGPNLNMLGIREPDRYGRETYDDLLEKIWTHCRKHCVTPSFYQSNHEGIWWTGYSRLITRRRMP